jgi:hypothetical protein
MGRSKTALMTPNMAVLVPIPSANVKTARAAKPGSLRILLSVMDVLESSAHFCINDANVAALRYHAQRACCDHGLQRRIARISQPKNNINVEPQFGCYSELLILLRIAPLLLFLVFANGQKQSTDGQFDPRRSSRGGESMSVNVGVAHKKIVAWLGQLITRQELGIHLHAMLQLEVFI